MVRLAKVGWEELKTYRSLEVRMRANARCGWLLRTVGGVRSGVEMQNGSAARADRRAPRGGHTYGLLRR